MFVHLHVHSHYSFLDSTLSVGEIVEAARQAGMSAVALTDTNGLYAVVPFARACRAAGIKPILGAEIDGFDPPEMDERILFRTGLEGPKKESVQSGGPFPQSKIPDFISTPRAVVLARDAEGYAEISRLVTRRGVEETGENQKSQVSGSLLEALLALSENHVWILTDSPVLLRVLAGRRNVFAELILTARRRGLCRRLYELAAALHIPIVATCDVHFACRDDYPLYRLLRAIAAQRTIETLDDEAISDFGFSILDCENMGKEEQPPDEHKFTQIKNPYESGKFGQSVVPFPQSKIQSQKSKINAASFAVVDAEHYFRTPAEMARLFRGLGSALRNTLYIAERCNVDWALREPPLLGGWKFPRVTLPAGETAFSHLWKVTFDGLKQRYRPLTPTATRRLEYELEIIARLGFAEYFLAVHEIADEARRRGWLLLGRGSAANSIVSFALGLTPVDPIRHNLYFERFLNPERRSPPDIDLDFSWRQRDDVVRWIFDHFGRDRVALIATHITLQPRQAIREVGKAMGLAEAEVNRFTRPIPGWLGEGKRLAELPEIFPECRDLPVGQEPWKTILACAERLIGFPRHLSIHCGGLLITPEPVTNYTPLVRSTKGPIITQMEMHAIEALGLIKMDILGNRSLGVLRDCVRTVEVGSGKAEEWENAGEKKVAQVANQRNRIS
ncbi:MAG: PHP domain-containing protein [Candidatus Sumerlaeia bacterium]|nr:PHP domain-containing protein [Candidatus Sumerlaeia bacterium]